MNSYAIEKAAELERELRYRRQPVLPPEPPRPRKPVFGSVVATAGRALRRAGEGLESWANVPVAEDPRLVRRTR
jgi:hypothetical protein